MEKVDLSLYNNSPYHPGAGWIKRVLWHYVNLLFFKSPLFPFYGLKQTLIKLFGAKIGRTVNFKPGVNIKYPWHLSIGNNVWIGENAWIDCLVPVTIGHNVCISQGATLLTGSHNYKKRSFDLITGSIVLEDGVWIGAFAVINQGVTVSSHAVVTTGTVVTKDLDAYGIYQGNPAIKVRDREINP